MAGTEQFDAIIIGGSYAGLSAAMTLGRSVRKVLVIDNGKPCNASTPHSHNFLTRDGDTPAAIAAIAREQVAHYPTVRFYEGLAVNGNKEENGFVIDTSSGDQFRSRKLIMASGIKDQLPDIPGFKECWGKSVIHCPYCHGYEYRHRKTAIWANGEFAVHFAQLINNLTPDLTLLTNEPSALTPEQAARLTKHGIGVLESPIIRIEHQDGILQQVVLEDGTALALEALYARLPFVQGSAIPSSLGCELTEQGYLKIDNFQRTTIPGVFACGDNSNFMRSVANAVASGNFTGAAVNKELTDEDF